MASLCSVFEQANIVRGKCDRGALFAVDQKYGAIDLFNMAGEVDQYPFYTRVAGFHVRKQIELLRDFYGFG